jgi:hypothetical protein
VTIANNTANSTGGGMYLVESNPILTNSIIWGNSPESIDLLIGIEEPIITYSDIEGDTNWTGESNINLDPLFTDSENDDYTLMEGSPCIDAGIIIEDMEYCGEVPDMGAYEYCEDLSITSEIPISYQIQPAYPNPFNPTTTISFSIPEFGLTTITAYDITGRQLETLTNEVLNVGSYSINWNASSHPSGVYLIRMESGDFTQTQKVVLIK